MFGFFPSIEDKQIQVICFRSGRATPIISIGDGRKPNSRGLYTPYKVSRHQRWDEFIPVIDPSTYEWIRDPHGKSP